MKKTIPHQQSEAQAAHIYGEPVPASGAIREAGKADIIGKGDYEGLRGENKYTDAQSYSLKLASLKKIELEAFMCGSEDWFFRIDFAGQVYIVQSEKSFREGYE